MHRTSLQMRRNRFRGKCGLSTSGDETSCLTTGPDQLYPRVSQDIVLEDLTLPVQEV